MQNSYSLDIIILVYIYNIEKWLAGKMNKWKYICLSHGVQKMITKTVRSKSNDAIIAMTISLVIPLFSKG